MAKIKDMKITGAQLMAIVDAADLISATIGVGSEEENSYYDRDTKRIVRLIDRFLNNNGYKREYN